MHGRSLFRLLLVPCLLLAVSGCGAPATPAVKPSVRIVAPATGSTLRMNPRVAGPINVTIRLTVSHFTLGGSDQLRLYENGKLWDTLFSNSISLSLVPGTYLFTATLVKSGKVVATSVPSAVSVVNALVPTTILSTVGCGAAAAAAANTQPRNSASIRLTCLPNTDSMYQGGFAAESDSSGNLWFVVGSAAGSPLGVGRITPSGAFSLFSQGLPEAALRPSGNRSSCLNSLTPGPGGMWFACPGAIGKVSPSGTISVFTKGLPPSATINSLVLGAGGDMWFSGSGFIGKITPSGTITLFTTDLPAGSDVSSSPIPGPGGDMWFSGSVSSRPFVGTVSPAGVVTVFTRGLPKSGAVILKSGSGADMWFTTSPNDDGYGPGFSGFGMITPSGTVTTVTRYVLSLTAGSGGAMWFGYLGGIGKVSPSGVVQVFTKDLTANMWTNPLVPGPGGDMWFTGNANSGSFVGKIAPSGTVSVLAKGVLANGLSGGGTLPGGPIPGPDGSMWLYGLGQNDTIFIDQITPAGTSTVLTWGLPAGDTFSSSDPLVSGLRGDLWFSGRRSNGTRFIGQLSLAGKAAAVP